jgi:hypothetical protein
MTDIVPGTHVLVGIVALGAFLVAFYWPWQAVLTDIARQVVFEKRDAIFDIALAGGISFDNREYRTIRIALEQLIRFAHMGTLPRIAIAAACAWRRGEFPKRTPIQIAIERIPDAAVREAITKLVKNAVGAVAITMAARSLPVVLLFPLTLLLICVLVICHNLTKALARDIGIVILAESSASSERSHRTTVATA